MSITKGQQLHDKYGGKWTYDKMCTWHCDDNIREVSRVSSCSCNQYCNHPVLYYLYDNSDTMTKVDFE